MKTIAILPVLGFLAACATTGRPSEQITKILRVPVRAPCPAKADYDKLKASRPVPLRQQPMPASKEERVAKSEAQLGRYEAEGGWSDQVSAALDRCQRGDEPVGLPQPTDSVNK